MPIVSTTISGNSGEANNNRLHYHYFERKPICFELKAITFAINCSEIHCFIVEKCNEENDGKAHRKLTESAPKAMAVMAVMGKRTSATMVCKM